VNTTATWTVLGMNCNLVLLESLSPEQRAAFLLREVFDYPYDQIATIVATSEDNARQLVARARRHVAQRRPRFEPSRERRERAWPAVLRRRPTRGPRCARRAARPRAATGRRGGWWRAAVLSVGAGPRGPDP
jgi:hypothetical protein